MTRSVSKLIKSASLIAAATLILVLVAVFAYLTLVQVEEDDMADYSIEKLREIPIGTIDDSLKVTSKSYPYESMYGSLESETIKKQASSILESQKLPSQPPIDWTYEFDTNRSLNFNIHSWDMLNQLLYAYDKSQKREYLEQAKLIAIDWIDNNSSQLVNNQDDNFAWYDMAVGIRAYRLSYILEQTVKSSIGTPDERYRMYQSLLDHFEYLKNDVNIIFQNNHGLYQAAGQRAAARRLATVAPKEFRLIEAQSSERIERITKEQFTSEGVHKEHSPGYHYAVYTTLLRMKQDGLIDSAETVESIASSGNSLYWMIKPNGNLVEFGDTESDTTVGDSVINHDESAENLAYHMSGGETGVLPEKQIKTFKGSGFAAIKNSKSYLGQQAAFHSQYHKHADDLTISWYDNGQDILIDSGKYGYLGRTKQGTKDYDDGFWYSDPKRQYVEKTRAHNTVEIDGKDFLRKGRKPFGSAIQDSSELDDGVYYIKSNVKQFNSIDFTRYLVFKPGKWLVVSDDLNDEQKASHEYKQWFHFAENLDISSSGQGYTTTVSGDKLTIASFNASSKESVKGQTRPHLQGWYSSAPWKLSPNQAIAFKASGASANISTMFAFGDKVNVDTIADKQQDSQKLSWKIGSTQYDLKFDDTQAPVLTVK